MYASVPTEKCVTESKTSHSTAATVIVYKSEGGLQSLVQARQVPEHPSTPLL